MSQPIRTLIVDDEVLGRQRIRTLLDRETDIDVVDECANGQEAVSAIEQHAPDLVFLDVQMPLMDGFEVLEAIDAELMPVVIFVTAYDEHALRAFDVHALDYLVKPFDRERFRKALQRARTYLQREQLDELSQRVQALLDSVEEEQREQYAKRLVVKSAGQVFFVNVDDVDWMEAAGNYVCLHLDDKTHLIRETMSGLEARLDPECFMRIHRSTIVNLDRIRSLQPHRNGEYVVTLHDDTRLPSSRSYRDQVQALIDGRT